jgi:hypothetical protein
LDLRPWVNRYVLAQTCADMNLGLPTMFLHVLLAQAAPISPQGDN